MALDMLTFGRFSLLAAVLAPSFWAGAGWAAPSLAGLAAGAAACCCGATAHADNKPESVTMAKAFFKANPIGWAMADFTPKLLSACATATRIYKIINTNA
jgi:hypothetical protein